MKTLATLFFALVTAVCLSGVPAWAQHGGGGHPGGGPPAGSPGMGPGSGMPSMGPASGMPGMGHGEEAGPPSSSNRPDFATGKEAGTDVLSRNTKLCGHLSSALGTSCSDLQSACSGFKNLGQCVAAWRVSQNVGGACSFSSLKGTMLGGSKLGSAIQTCDPKVNSKAEARKAEKQANRDIRRSGS
jgi:hypothetical protein